MRFKKILAGITAGALALSSLSVALWATDNTATVKTMIMHPKTWATDKAASFESDVNEVVAINLKGYEDTIKKVRIEFVDITTDYIKPVLITNNWDADKTPQSVYDASYFSPTIKDGKATLDVEFGVTKEASDSGEGDVNGLSFASGYGTIEFKVNMNWMNAGSVSLSNITFFDANENEVVQVEALTDTIPFSGTEADPDWKWTETTFVSSSSSEMTDVDVTGTDKIIFNAAAFDLNYGWNGGKFMTSNSDESNYQEKSFGAENKKPVDVLLEETGKFSIEVPINITETGGFILKAGTDAKSGAFELVSIEFYKGDTKLGVWKNHEFVSSTVPVTGVTVLPNTISLKLGETQSLKETVVPETATDKTVTWKSSDETIATVDSTGKVTGVKAGKATITATAGEKSAECAVTVTAKPEETQPTEPDNPTPGDTITVYELNADELKLLSDPKTTFTISYNSPNGWNDIGFGASMPDESWASASLPAKQGDGTLKVTVEDLIKSMKVKEEGDVTTLDGVTYCKVEGYNGTVFYSVKVEIPTEPDEPDKPIEGMTANLKLYTQGNDGAGWAWKDFGDDSIKTVTVSDDSEAVELKWTIAVDEKVDSADKFSAGGLQIVFDDPDCAYVGQKVNIYITEITLGGEKKDDITKEETSIVANWNNTGSEIMVNLSDISFENVGKEYSCKVKITPVSKAPDQPDQPGEDDTTTTTKAPTGFYTPDESTTTTPSDTTTAPDSGSTPATADTTELTNDDNGVKVEFAAGTVKEGAVLNVNKSGETATSATFDITLNLNGAAIQPDGTLTITINIPAGLAGAANYYVYRVETDGTYTDMLAALADGKLTFKTGHLSEYVISTVKLTDTGVVNGDDSSTASSAPVEDNGANTGNADNEPAGDNGGNGNTGSTGGNTDDKNVATGIVIAFIPAAAAAAAVVISKKRK